jgi:hypothetical protein
MEIWERGHSITMTSRHETVFLPELYENVCGALSALWVGGAVLFQGRCPWLWLRSAVGAEFGVMTFSE